ncbi:hypothetical protein GCM10018779_21070 [Streptomyces griseocarneus]|nr:hypothetical protein GCM10018779_21070 [Streptomyces griseocarneus]
MPFFFRTSSVFGVHLGSGPSSIVRATDLPPRSVSWAISDDTGPEGPGSAGEAVGVCLVASDDGGSVNSTELEALESPESSVATATVPDITPARATTPPAAIAMCRLRAVKRAMDLSPHPPRAT